MMGPLQEEERLPFPAAILTGGRSRRMGCDKFLLPLGTEPVISRVGRTLEKVFSRVFAVGGDAASLGKFGFQVVEDIFPGNDSLGGLHAAIARAGTSHVFVAGCDMPFLQIPLLRGLGALAGGAEVVIPVRDGYLEPLCAVYGRSCEPVIRRRISEGRLKMIGFHDQVRVVQVEEVEWRRWDPEGLSFRNLNTPEDYERALAEVAAEESQDAS